MKSFIGLLELIFIFSVPFMLNAQTGVTIQWQKSYGGVGAEEAHSIQQTNDGGYIMAGYSYGSPDSNATGNHGLMDAWVVKTDPLGVVQWQKCYGGSENDIVNCIIQTNDGGYIFACETYSWDGDVVGNHGEQDIWVVKINSSGAIQWKMCYGGSGYEYVQRIRQTPDGGYIFAGSASSNNGDVTGNHGNEDFWIVKIDISGYIQWQKCYGGYDWDRALGIILTSEGGYAIAGLTL
ncbi:MAG: hypothetical protein WCL00_08770, partial [Bacteroidota bacterium]